MKKFLKIFIKTILMMASFVFALGIIILLVRNDDVWLPFRYSSFGYLLNYLFLVGLPVISGFVVFKTINYIVNGIYDKKWKSVLISLIIYILYFSILIFLMNITFPVM